MRLLLLVLLTSCGSPSTPPPTPVTPITKIHPPLAKRVRDADAIVRGTMFISATDDASVGTIRVDAILKGAIAPDVSFISIAQDGSDKPAIFFLQREGERYRSDIAVDASQEAAIIAAVGDAPAIDWSAVKTELAAFHARKDALDATRKIFATVPMTGATTRDIRGALGAPTELLPDGRWRYTRHDGEQGAIYALRVVNDRVRVIEIHRTE
jgi:hypothetical protein